LVTEGTIIPATSNLPIPAAEIPIMVMSRGTQPQKLDSIKLQESVLRTLVVRIKELVQNSNPLINIKITLQVNFSDKSHVTHVKRDPQTVQRGDEGAWVVAKRKLGEDIKKAKSAAKIGEVISFTIFVEPFYEESFSNIQHVEEEDDEVNF
jgi:hypothetical protein